MWLCALLAPPPHVASCCAALQVREYLQKIRSEFEALLAENNRKPEAERLAHNEFEIDPGGFWGGAPPPGGEAPGDVNLVMCPWPWSSPSVSPCIHPKP